MPFVNIKMEKVVPRQIALFSEYCFNQITCSNLQKKVFIAVGKKILLTRYFERTKDCQWGYLILHILWITRSGRKTGWLVDVKATSTKIQCLLQLWLVPNDQWTIQNFAKLHQCSRIAQLFQSQSCNANSIQSGTHGKTRGTINQLWRQK